MAEPENIIVPKLAEPAIRPKRNHKAGLLVLGIVAVTAAITLGLAAFSGGGSHGPAGAINGPGTYTVGRDIAAGTYKITTSAGTPANPCTYSVWRDNQNLLGASSSILDKAKAQGDPFWSSAEKLPTGADGIAVTDGELFVVGNCGTWSLAAA